MRRVLGCGACLCAGTAVAPVTAVLVTPEKPKLSSSPNQKRFSNNEPIPDYPSLRSMALKATEDEDEEPTSGDDSEDGEKEQPQNGEVQEGVDSEKGGVASSSSACSGGCGGDAEEDEANLNTEGGNKTQSSCAASEESDHSDEQDAGDEENEGDDLYEDFELGKHRENMQDVAMEEGGKKKDVFSQCGMASSKRRLSKEEIPAHESWPEDTEDYPAKSDQFKAYYNDAGGIEKNVRENCEFVKRALDETRTTSSKTKNKKKDSKKPAVAYLLTVSGNGFDDLYGFDQYQLWQQYFRGCPEASANLYIHAKGGPIDLENEKTLKGKNFPEPAQAWKTTLRARKGEAKFVKKVHQAWGELVGVMHWVTLNGLQNANNQHFVFLPQDAIPLKSCQHVTRMLLGSDGDGAAEKKKKRTRGENEMSTMIQASKSNICVAPYSPLDQTGIDCFSSHHYSALAKTHQWVTLTREDAVRFGKYAIRALNLWIENSLRTPFAGVFQTMGATDEGTPAAALVVSLTADAAVVAKNGPFADREKTALHYLMEHVGGASRCATFILWGKCFANSTGIPDADDRRNSQPRDYHGDDWKNREVDDTGSVTPHLSSLTPAFMRSLVQFTGFLFGRKMGMTVTSVTRDEEGEIVKKHKELRYDMSKEAWPGAKVGLREIWEQKPASTLGESGPPEQTFSLRVEGDEEKKKGHIFRLPAVLGNQYSFRFGKMEIPTALHAPDGSLMQQALREAMNRGRVEAVRRGEE